MSTGGIDGGGRSVAVRGVANLDVAAARGAAGGGFSSAGMTGS
jgi:hypothetical protein